MPCCALSSVSTISESHSATAATTPKVFLARLRNRSGERGRTGETRDLVVSNKNFLTATWLDLARPTKQHCTDALRIKLTITITDTKRQMRTRIGSSKQWTVGPFLLLTTRTRCCSGSHTHIIRSYKTMPSLLHHFRLRPRKERTNAQTNERTHKRTNERTAH